MIGNADRLTFDFALHARVSPLYRCPEKNYAK
jgi:hypothetical protein